MSENDDPYATSSPQELVPVLAAVITRDSRYLVCKRPHWKRHGGLWEFPGGKLEPGESWLEAARREMEEELGLTVERVGEPVFAVHDEGSPFVITFVPVHVDGEPRPTEHEEVRWLSIEELAHVNLAPSDGQFVEWLKSA